MPQRQAATIIHKLALAMDEAHRCGIVHRDLKPMNILIDKRGEPVIVDFGLARQINQKVFMTQRGAALGTPAYMAPEQVAGDLEKVGPACDIYSLGVMLYELLAGRLPFDTAVEMIASQVLQREPPPPSTYRPDVDPRLQAICLKAMSYRIENRYFTMADLAEALTDYLSDRKQPAALPPDLKQVLDVPTPATNLLQLGEKNAPALQEAPVSPPKEEAVNAAPPPEHGVSAKESEPPLTVLPAKEPLTVLPADESSIIPAQKEPPTVPTAQDNPTLPLDEEVVPAADAGGSARAPVTRVPSKEPIEVVPDSWPEMSEEDPLDSWRERPHPPPADNPFVAGCLISACVLLGLAIGGVLLYLSLR
jgi:serine/threonine protein kinase